MQKKKKKMYSKGTKRIFLLIFPVPAIPFWTADYNFRRTSQRRREREAVNCASLALICLVCRHVGEGFLIETQTIYSQNAVSRQRITTRFVSTRPDPRPINRGGRLSSVERSTGKLAGIYALSSCFTFSAPNWALLSAGRLLEGHP